MKTYVMVMQTATLGLSWTYEFEAASDTMAREYATRQVPQLVQIPWFMALVVFDKAEDRSVAYLRGRVNVEVIEG